MMQSSTLPLPIDPASQIYKLSVHPGDPTTRPPTWSKGSNACFNFTVHAYVTPELDAAANEEAQRITQDHAHGHPKDKHDHDHKHDPKTDRESKLKQRSLALESILTQLKSASSPTPPTTTTTPTPSATPSPPNATTPPTRRLISSSKSTNPPTTPHFSLRIGLGFSVPMLEKCVRTMRPGERARFLCLPSETDGFAHLESLLRTEKLNRERVAQGKPAIRTSGCCAAQMSEGGQETMEMQKELLVLSGAVLELEIELDKVEEPGGFVKEVWEMSAVEKYAEAPVRKAEGGVLYGKGMFGDACDKYTRALVLLESLSQSPSVTDAQRDMTRAKEERDKEVRRRVLERKRLERVGKPVPEEFTVQSVERYLKETDASISNPDYSANNGINPSVVISLMQTCRLNYAACKLKLGEFVTVVVQCSEVIKNDKTNVKALFRRAQAYRKIGRDLELAQKDLNALRDLLVGRGAAEENAEFMELKREEKELDAKLKAVEMKEKKMFSNMFSA
ncbi:hypothetical protein HDU98_010655 [Podochytrium sp. JEL0797]|nr:hypothetical protein HDU98_010655 [Podochytrium sp. JEL0797]